MMICGWCRNSGEYMGKTCHCTTRRKPYFPPKKKRREDVIPEAHKCSFHYLNSTAVSHWSMCDCGKTKREPINA